MRPLHESLPLGICIGPDPALLHHLLNAVRTVGRIAIAGPDALCKKQSAVLAIIDCRRGLMDPKRSIRSDIPTLAVLEKDRLERQAVFETGYFDYLLWPIMTAELSSRLDASLLAVARKDAVPLFAIDPIVQASCDLLSRRILVRTSLAELAQRTGTNRTTLVNRFQACFGCGPIAWLRHHRMTEAARLLRSNFQSITEIAQSVGYENSNNFSTAFKAHHGISPLRYRKMALRREKND